MVCYAQNVVIQYLIQEHSSSVTKEKVAVAISYD